MTASSPITIVAMPKPFDGHIGVIQRNAVTSWSRLIPRPEIFLFGEEEGIAEVATELGIRHMRDIARNEFGTPLLDDLLCRTREATPTSLICYVNSDIILLQEFWGAVQQIQWRFPRFLGVMHRLNIDLQESLDFASGGEKKLRDEILPLGCPGDHSAIDVFVFHRDSYQHVPPLALGRAWFDQWLIKDAHRQGIPVVDITRVTRAIHQNHDYGHIVGGQQGAYWGEEALRSLAIYGGNPHAFTLLDVTHELLTNGEIRRVRYRRVRHVAREWFWRNLVLRTASMRGRLGLRRRSLRRFRDGDTTAKV
jgi:hypothetical protein